MTNKILKIGFIGCGRVFDHYLKLFKKNKIPLMKIVACCDKDLNKLKKKTQSENIKNYSKFSDMIKKEVLDLVIILSPSGLHYNHTKFALKKGVNVLCEKPMSLKVKDCEDLIKISKKKKVFYGVVFQNRLNKAIQFLRKEIKSNKLGKIIFCNVRLIWSRDNDYYSDGWHGTWKMDGGVLNQQLIHHLDAMINIVSEVIEINSFSSTRVNRLECEDTISASFKLKNGALGQIIGTTGFRPNDTEASIELITNKGIYKIGGVALNMVSNWIINGKENKNKFQKYSEKFDNGYGNGHEKLLNMISQKLLSKKNIDNFSWCSQKALKTSKIVSKIYKSIEIKKNISLNDKLYSSKLGNYNG
jgi:UDP-N-acetyl-2-amino-2-deoxyglucuronate dehydrogenase